MILLFVIVLLAAIVSSLPLKKWSKWTVVAGEMLLEEGGNLATERLRQEVKTVLNGKLNTQAKSRLWDKCLNVPVDLVQKVLDCKNTSELKLLLPTG